MSRKKIILQIDPIDSLDVIGWTRKSKAGEVRDLKLFIPKNHFLEVVIRRNYVKKLNKRKSK